MTTSPATDAASDAAGSSDSPAIIHTERTHRVSVQTENGPALSRGASVGRGLAQVVSAEPPGVGEAFTGRLPVRHGMPQGESRSRTRAEALLTARVPAPHDRGTWTPSAPDEGQRARAQQAEAALQDRLASLRGALSQTARQVDQLENMLKSVSNSKEPS